jgi:hypothetical protein
MTMVLGEGHYMGTQTVPQWNYNGGYTTKFPTWVGGGRKCDHYPNQSGKSFYAPMTKVSKL